MRRLILVALATLATTAVAQEECAGTLPGREGNPLTLTGTLILLDVTQINGAEHMFSAAFALLSFLSFWG